jgi:hypothetical protein
MSDLERLAFDLETKTDEYAEAVLKSANAENAYNLAYYTLFARLNDSPATIRGKLADSQCIDERALWTHRQAVERALRAKVQSLQSCLVAAQSAAKWQGRQDGGIW